MTEQVERTFIVKTKGRTWFTGVMGGHKARLAINEVSTDLPLDSIVTFVGEDLSTSSKYGTDVKFVAKEIISVRDAAQARAAASAHREAERWLGYAETDVRRGASDTNAIRQALHLAPAHPDLADRVAALQTQRVEATRLADMRYAERYVGYAEGQVADGLTSSSSITTALERAPKFPELTDRVAALRAAIETNRAAAAALPVERTTILTERPVLGVPVKMYRRWVVYTQVLRSTRIDDDDPSVYGSHLYGYEGSRGVLVTYRDATETEVAQAETEKAERDAVRRAKTELDRRAMHLLDYVFHVGETPEPWVEVDGEHLLGEPTIYGGGRWLVITDEWIWAIRNNGADGDDWSYNNVRTAGAGAMGRRAARTDELAREIRELHDKGARA